MLVTVFLGANDAAVCTGEDMVEERDEEMDEKITQGATDNPPHGSVGQLSAEDSTKRGQSSSQYVPLHEYRTNIITIVTHVKKVENNETKSNLLS